MRVQQIKLTRATVRGHEVQTCWVEQDARLHPGVAVTGKDGQQWTVAEVYPAVMEWTQLRRDWHVGGL